MSKILKSTPKKDGFRMPGEFEPHKETWLIWPERPDNWRNGGKPAQQAFVNVAEAISQGEPVTMVVSPAQYVTARQMLPDEVRVVEMTNNDSWMRDCGPTFVANDNGEVRGIDWNFNSWGGLDGGLYFPWDQDDLVAQKVLEIENFDRYTPGIVLEGGSIDVDGEGTLFVTEECLLNSNRNPQLDKDQIATVLKENLNLEKIIWLPRGVYMDETDGHVDNFCRFIRPGVVVLTWTDDKDDPQYERSQETYEILKRATDAKGRKLEIHKLIQPGPLFMTDEESKGVDIVPGTQPRREGDRLAGSYVNFFVGNGIVVMPTFDVPQDQPAQEKMKELFPDRKILTVPGREILLGGGNVHCITQQQPRGITQKVK